jgi:WD40 repeat protein
MTYRTQVIFLTTLVLCLEARFSTCLLGQDRGHSQETAEKYLAHLAAANSALRLNEASEARTWLDQIPESARDWEWKLLDAKTDSSIHVLSTDSWRPVRMDLSVDGARLAVAASDGFVRIYSTNSLELLAEWQVSEQTVYAARFHPSGKQLATCSRDGKISVWEIDSKKQLWSEKNGGQGLADLVYRPDGEELLFCSWYRGPAAVLGIVSTWNSATGQQSWKTDFGVKPIVTARYSPDGKQFAVGTWDAIVGVWQSNAPGEPRVLDFSDRAQYSAIDDIAFSPDGKQLAAATKNGTPRIWSLGETKSHVDMVGHSNAVFCIAFSGDGKSLLTAGSDGVLAVWDIAQRNLLHRFYGHTNRVISIQASLTQDRVFTASADKTLRIWDLGDVKGFESSEAGKYVYGLVVANGGKQIVTGGQAETTISVWDASSKKAMRHFAGVDSTINYLDGDGKNWVAGGNWNGDVRIWDVDSGEVVQQMGSKDLGGMQQCSLSDDRRWLASATNKKQVVIWDASTGEVAKLIPMPNGCWGLDFSADSKALAVGDGQGNVHWISTDNWETQWTCNGGTPSQIYTLQIAKSMEWLAVGDESGQLAIIDVQQKRVIHQTQAHSERIWSLDISPDSKRLVTGSADHKLKTWDPRSGVSLMTIADFPDPLYNLKFSSDGRSLFVNCLGSRISKLSID